MAEQEVGGGYESSGSISADVTHSELFDAATEVVIDDSVRDVSRARILHDAAERVRTNDYWSLRAFSELHVSADAVAGLAQARARSLDQTHPKDEGEAWMSDIEVRADIVEPTP